MVELWMIFFLMLVMLRFIAPYDSRYIKGKYVEIKNPILRSLLIDKMGFWDKTNRRKKDINKITILGIVLYIYAAVSAILAILSYVFVSKSQVEPIIFESEELDFQLDTLNELYAGSFLASFYALFMVVIGVGLFKWAKKENIKWIRIMLYAFSLFVIGVAIALIIMMLYEATRL